MRGTDLLSGIASASSIRVRLGILMVLILAVLSGCGRYYWARGGATPEDFRLASQQCAEEASPTPEAARAGLVAREVYRACLGREGWVRERHAAPPPSGWYRGIE